MVASHNSLETSTINSTHALSPMRKVHNSSFPLKGNEKPYRQSCTNTTVTIAMTWTYLQYPLISDLFLSRDLTLVGIFKRTSLQGIFISHI
jgi:hypothetical protein